MSIEAMRGHSARCHARCEVLDEMVTKLLTAPWTGIALQALGQGVIAGL